MNLEISVRSFCNLFSLRDILKIKEDKNRVKMNKEINKWDGESYIRLYKTVSNSSR